MRMSNDGELDQLVPDGDAKVFSGAIGFDKKSRLAAKQLHDAVYIYALYGVLDGLSLSYSMIKYSFDLLYTNSSFSSSDVMHDWMLTPEGIAIAATESIVLIGFSLLANVFSECSKTDFQKYISIAWPYCRDTMKGLKNAYKGMRSTLQIAGLLANNQDMRFMMVPVGVGLGIISVLNRICMRKYVVEPRKAMMKVNAFLLLEVKGERDIHVLKKEPDDMMAFCNSYLWMNERLHYVSVKGVLKPVPLTNAVDCLAGLKLLPGWEEGRVHLSLRQIDDLIIKNGGDGPPAMNLELRAYYLERLGVQTPKLRRLALIGGAYSGVVDGLYLFMGIFTLAAVSPPVFVAMVVFSALFSALCIVTRIYEEYDFQKRLVGTQAKVKLALCGKELGVLFSQLRQLELAPEDEKRAQTAIMTQLENKMEEFNQCRVYLREQLTLSTLSAALLGLKNGLAAYSAIASVMFAVATVMLLASTPFPPAFLITGVATGVVCLIIFLSHALINNHGHLNSLQSKVSDPHETLADWLKKLKNNEKIVSDLQPTEVESTIMAGMIVDPSPQFFFQEWFEVVRSFFSGLAKGQKSVEYTLNPLEEADSQGHYHDTLIMVWITMGAASLYAAGLALRAFARGFGRDNIEDVAPKSEEKACPVAPRGTLPSPVMQVGGSPAEEVAPLRPDRGESPLLAGATTLRSESTEQVFHRPAAASLSLADRLFGGRRQFSATELNHGSLEAGLRSHGAASAFMSPPRVVGITPG